MYISYAKWLWILSTKRNRHITGLVIKDIMNQPKTKVSNEAQHCHISMVPLITLSYLCRHGLTPKHLNNVKFIKFYANSFGSYRGIIKKAKTSDQLAGITQLLGANSNQIQVNYL
jgi:hypothetical protein